MGGSENDTSEVALSSAAQARFRHLVFVLLGPLRVRSLSLHSVMAPLSCL
jgi:hypothetical protein